MLKPKSWNASGLIACMSQARRPPSLKLVVLQGTWKLTFLLQGTWKLTCLLLGMKVNTLAPRWLFPLCNVKYYITLHVPFTFDIVFWCAGISSHPHICRETWKQIPDTFCSRVLLYVQMILYGAPILMLIRCLYANQPYLREFKEKLQSNINV